MSFRLEFTKDNLQSCAELINISALLKSAPVKQFISTGFSAHCPGSYYSDLDIFKSYIGLLSAGFSSFENIDAFRKNSFFSRAMGLRQAPSKETLRQRLDKLSVPGALPVLSAWNRDVLLKWAAPLPIAGTTLIPVDFDVTVMDNTGSHREGVARTYQKNVEGYAPMMSYIGA